jgi:hypothetical protein
MAWENSNTMDFNWFCIAAIGLFWQQTGFGIDFASIRRVSYVAKHFYTYPPSRIFNKALIT